ncbi:MAG: hypothetical protein M0Z99_11910 [Betaproteobacteria bacterium]|nr:hypothetical protein [Betaproteobacteria bacterium]
MDGVKGPTGHVRKCCGREGIIDSIHGAGMKAANTVKFDVIPGKDTMVTGLAVADLEKIQLESVPAAAPTPSQAAQAKGQSTSSQAAPAKGKAVKKPTAKKTKAKADPAAAAPPNEPATPAKTTALKPADAWPFPTGSRP